MAKVTAQFCLDVLMIVVALGLAPVYRLMIRCGTFLLRTYAEFYETLNHRRSVVLKLCGPKCRPVLVTYRYGFKTTKDCVSRVALLLNLIVHT
jgi:hypothetical protein